MSGSRLSLGSSSSQFSSYPEEVAQRIWEDMRLAKRRPKGSPDKLTQSGGMERPPSAARAAAQLRSSISRVAWDVRAVSPGTDEIEALEREARRLVDEQDDEAWGEGDSDTSDSRLGEEHLQKSSSRERERGQHEGKGRDVRHVYERRERAGGRRGREMQRGAGDEEGYGGYGGGIGRERRRCREGGRQRRMFDGHDRHEDGGDGMHIMWADITPAPRDAPVRSSSPTALRVSSALSLPQNNPNWSNPNALEARMLGVATDLARSESSDSRRRAANTHDNGRTRGFGPGDFHGALSDSYSTDESGSEAGSNLPDEMSSLLRVIGRGGAEEQEWACEALRSMIHQGGALVGLLARKQRSLEVLSRGLTGESEKARVSTASCFRYLALEAAACACVLRSTVVLPALVYALKNGSASAKHKTAAALGNLAWRDETTRERMLNTYGLVPSLLSLLWDAGEKGKTSCLAALANLTMNEQCAVQVAKSSGALDLLAHELQDGIDKAQVRAAGILRNMCATRVGAEAIGRSDATLRALRRMAEHALGAVEEEDDDKPLLREAGLRAVAALSFISAPQDHHSRPLRSPDHDLHALPLRDAYPMPEARQHHGHDSRDTDLRYHVRTHDAQGAGGRQQQPLLENNGHASPRGEGSFLGHAEIRLESYGLDVHDSQDGSRPQAGSQRGDYRDASPPPISASALSLNALASFVAPPEPLNHAAPPLNEHDHVLASSGTHASHPFDEQVNALPRNGPHAMLTPLNEHTSDINGSEALSPRTHSSSKAPSHAPHDGSSKAVIPGSHAYYEGECPSEGSPATWNRTPSDPKSNDDQKQDQNPFGSKLESYGLGAVHSDALDAPAPFMLQHGTSNLAQDASNQVRAPNASKEPLVHNKSSSAASPNPQETLGAPEPAPSAHKVSSVMSSSPRDHVPRHQGSAAPNDGMRKPVWPPPPSSTNSSVTTREWNEHTKGPANLSLPITSSSQVPHPPTLSSQSPSSASAARASNGMPPRAPAPSSAPPVVANSPGDELHLHTPMASKAPKAPTPVGQTTVAEIVTGPNAPTPVVEPPKMRLDEEAAVQVLKEWLGKNGWDNISRNLFEAMGTDMGRYRMIEEDMEELDAAQGLYTYHGHTLRLVGKDRQHPEELVDEHTGEVWWDAQREQKALHPWAKKHFSLGPEGRRRIVLKRTGQVVLDDDASLPLNAWTEQQQVSSSPFGAAGVQAGAVVASVAGHSSEDGAHEDARHGWRHSGEVLQPLVGVVGALPPPHEQQPHGHFRSNSGGGLLVDGKIVKMPQHGNPALWRLMMGEARIDADNGGTMVWRGRLLSAPKCDKHGYAVVRDLATGEVVYDGPGIHEVFPPHGELGQTGVRGQLLDWAAEHGWHDLRRRLLDAGSTDYSAYAKIDSAMQPIAGGPKLFKCQGRVLLLEGDSRKKPLRLVDYESKLVIWDKEACTSWTYPWAREALVVTRAGDRIVVADKKSGGTVVSLELASHRCSPRVDMSDEEVGRRLFEWTRAHGWFDLQRRLFDFVEIDFSKYAQFEQRMVAVHGTSNLFEYEGRLLRLDGLRTNPVRLVDVNIGVVLWERDSSSKVAQPWAQAALVLRPVAQGFEILSSNTGARIVDVSGGRQGADLLLYQSIRFESVPMAKVRNLEGIKGMEALMQVTRDYKPEGAAEGFIHVNEGDVVYLTSRGQSGWAHGRVVLHKSGKMFFDNRDATGGWGAAGWYPDTFALRLLDLSKWRKRVLYTTVQGQNTVMVSDALTGEMLYSGPVSSPRVEWHLDAFRQHNNIPPVPTIIAVPSTVPSTAHNIPPSPPSSGPTTLEALPIQQATFQHETFHVKAQEQQPAPQSQQQRSALHQQGQHVTAQEQQPAPQSQPQRSALHQQGQPPLSRGSRRGSIVRFSTPELDEADQRISQPDPRDHGLLSVQGHVSVPNEAEAAQPASPKGLSSEGLARELPPFVTFVNPAASPLQRGDGLDGLHEEQEIPPISPVSPSLSFASVSMPSSSPSPVKRSNNPHDPDSSRFFGNGTPFAPSGDADKGCYSALGADVRALGASFERDKGTPVAVSPVSAQQGIVKSSPFKQRQVAADPTQGIVRSSPFTQAAAQAVHNPEKASVSPLIRSSPFMQQDSQSPHPKRSVVRFSPTTPSKLTEQRALPTSIIDQKKAELSSASGRQAEPSRSSRGSASGSTTNKRSPIGTVGQARSVKYLQNRLDSSHVGGGTGRASNSGWKFNRDLFDSAHAGGVAAEFTCEDTSTIGTVKEEVLELQASGSFVYGTRRPQLGKGTVWIVLRGSYRLSEAARGGGQSDLILRVELKVMGYSKTNEQEEEVVEGVYVRGRAQGGQHLTHVEWVSGHEEMDIGVCKAKLVRR